MSSTVIVLGATGYMGQTFAQELEARGHSVKRLSRKQVDYARFDVLLKYLREAGPDFLVNAAGYTGKPNVDACEIFKADTLVGNTLLPQTIAHACEAAGVPWGHISSGCIYSGAKIEEGGQVRTEKDLNTPELKALVAGGGKGIHGFIETDPPNFSFRDPPCSFYSGTKALAEEAIAGIGRSYIWRLRIPFDQFDNPRNYLSKVQRYSKVYDNVNSISHRSDFTRACLDLWERSAPWETYNVTNPGFVTTRQVVELIQEILKPNRRFEFWLNDEEFYRVAAKTPRSNCVLDNSKLLSAGVRIRPVLEALRDSLRQWQPEKKT